MTWLVSHFCVSRSSPQDHRSFLYLDHTTVFSPFSKKCSYLQWKTKTIHRICCTPYKGFVMKLQRPFPPYVLGLSNCLVFLKTCGLYFVWTRQPWIWPRSFPAAVQRWPLYNFTLIQKRLFKPGLTAVKKSIVQLWIRSDVNVKIIWLIFFYNVACLVCIHPV